MPPTGIPVSEYERKRLETIAKNKALLKDLALDAAVSGLTPSKSRARDLPTSSGASGKRKREAPKVKKEVLPVRTSSRLRGLEADNQATKVKAEDEYQLRLLRDRVSRQRVSGDLSVGDIITSGSNWDQNGNFLRGVAPVKPYERTFELGDIKENSDADLRKLRERMSGLVLWGNVSPNRKCLELWNSSPKAYE
jgi:hypothetical protein